MKTIITVIGLLIIILFAISTLNNSTYYYNEGTFYYHKDDSVIKLSGVISLESIRPIIKKIKEAQGNIILEIDSPGGQAIAANILIEAMEKSNKKFICLVTRVAASAAVRVFSTCDERYMLSSSVLFFHRIMVTETSGNATSLRRLANELDLIEKPNIERILDEMNLSYEEMDMLAEKQVPLFSYKVEELGFAKTVHWEMEQE